MGEIVFNVGPYSFTTSAFLIGILLSQELSLEEQDSIGNWLQLVGLTMQTYASQKSVIDTDNDVDKDKRYDIEALKKAVKNIEEKLNNLYKDNKI